MGGFSTSSIPSGSGTYSIIAVDLNQDGDLDIVTGNILSEDISVLLGDGTGGFQNHVDYLLDPQGIGTGLASGDFDHDGHIDLAVATMGFVNVFHGAGGGLFDQQTFYMAGECPTNVAAADLDDDGWLDLVVSGDCEVDVMVLLGEPDGSFTYDAVWPMPTHPVAMRLADLNADGDADLITTGLGIANVRLGLPGSSFGSRVTYEVGIAAVGIAADDWNLDGDQDLAVMNGTQHSTVTVLLGNGTGGLGSRRDYGVGVNSSAIVSEDVDSDADPDLVVLSVANNHFCILENIAEPVSGVPEIGSGGAGRLEQVRVWPNPALSSVKIGFQADQPTPVTIRIHDVSGSLVRELANGQVFKEGRNTLAWDGLSDKGSAAPAGVYFAHVSSSAGSVTRRIVLAP
jgi:hypothetical protein